MPYQTYLDAKRQYQSDKVTLTNLVFVGKERTGATGIKAGGKFIRITVADNRTILAHGDPNANETFTPEVSTLDNYFPTLGSSSLHLILQMGTWRAH